MFVDFCAHRHAHAILSAWIQAPVHFFFQRVLSYWLVLIVKIKLLTDKDMSRPNFGESCRPLEQREVLEVLWTTYPPAATQLNVRSSRWLRPRLKGTEAWSLLGML